MNPKVEAGTSLLSLLTKNYTGAESVSSTLQSWICRKTAERFTVLAITQIGNQRVVMWLTLKWLKTPNAGLVGSFAGWSAWRGTRLIYEH